MKLYLSLLIILLSVNTYGQKSSALDDIDTFAKDSIFEITYIPILNSERDSIRYGYKIIPPDTSFITLEDGTMVKEIPFIAIKVTKVDFPGGDEKLIEHLYYHLNPIFLKNIEKNKKNYTIGYTTVKFKISRTGEVNDINIVKSSFYGYDKEIEKTIKSLPKFVPASGRRLAPTFYCLLSIKYPFNAVNKK